MKIDVPESAAEDAMIARRFTVRDGRPCTASSCREPEALVATAPAPNLPRAEDERRPSETAEGTAPKTRRQIDSDVDVRLGEAPRPLPGVARCASSWPCVRLRAEVELPTPSSGPHLATSSSCAPCLDHMSVRAIESDGPTPLRRIFVQSAAVVAPSL